MIIITKHNYKPYENVESREGMIIYQDMLPDKTKKKDKLYGIQILLLLITGKIFTTTNVSDEKAYFVDKKIKVDSINIKEDSIIFSDKDIPDSVIFYRLKYNCTLFNKISTRIVYMKYVKDLLKNIKKSPEWKQCIKEYETKLLGKGCFGNVYGGCIGDLKFASKYNKLDHKDLFKLQPYEKNISDWHEVYILKNIINPILEANICPNFPLLYETFTCESCSLNIKEKVSNHPCVLSITELANGTLKEYINSKPSVKELNSCLFQCMAGLHTMQMYGQIQHYDIKKENILFLNCDKDLILEYKIYNRSYFVPTFGKIFIINDFGVSRSMSPEHMIKNELNDEWFRLGHRFAIIKDSKFYPLESKNGTITVTLGRKKFKSDHVKAHFNDFTIKSEFVIPEKLQKYLKSKGLNDPLSKEFYLRPDIIPPFEFFNDTQDCIRIFTGGKRTTQNGSHSKPNIDNDFIKSLNPYVSKSKNLKSYKFDNDPSKVLAGEFIKLYFKDKYNEDLNSPNKQTYLIN